MAALMKNLGFRSFGGLLGSNAQRSTWEPWPGAALAVGAGDGNVQAGVAHDRVAVGEAAGVAQLGQDGRRERRPDPIVAGVSARQPHLAAGEGAQAALSGSS
jgi:hypothetical protein